MGSKCCDCITYWQVDNPVVDLKAVMTSPKKYSPIPSAPSCRVTLWDYNGSLFWQNSISLLNNIPLKKILVPGSLNPWCDCVNVNGGTLYNETLKPDQTIDLITRTRTTTKDYWQIICPGLWGSYYNQVSTVTTASYTFRAVIKGTVQSYAKEHKCGPTCGSDPIFNPPMFNYESAVMNQLVNISQNYKFS